MSSPAGSCERLDALIIKKVIAVLPEECSDFFPVFLGDFNSGSVY